MKSKSLLNYISFCVIAYYFFLSNAQVFGCVTQIEAVRFDGGAYLDAATLGVCPYTGPISTGYCKAPGSVLNTSITTNCAVCGWGSDMDATIWYDFDKDGIQDAGEVFPMNSCGVNTCYFYNVTIPTWVTPGPMNITIYTSFYGPIYEYTTYTINIGTLGTPAVPSGTLTRCQGAGSNSYTIPPVTGATSYIWTLTPAAAGSISGTGTTGTVTWNAAFAGTATVGVQATGPCGTSTQSTVNVTVNTAPGMPSAPAGTLTRCQGAGTSAYTTTATGATGYTWTLTPAAAGGITGTGTTGTVTWNAAFAGTATVSVTAVNACGTTGPVSTTVTVNAPSAGTATWIGGVSNDWFTAQNWSTCAVPTCATNVIINEVTAPNVHPVIASGTAACQNLNINGGPPPVSTLLTISAGATLDICGDYTHNSGADNVSYNGSSTIRFVGSTPQTYNVLSGGVTFGSVHINNGSTVTISGANMNLSASTNSKLRLASGRIITGTNLVQVQNNTVGAVYDHSVNSYVQGNLRRYVADGGPYDFPVGDAPISLGGKGYQLAQLTFPPGGRNNGSQIIDRVIGRFDPVTIPMSPVITAACPTATTPEPPLNNGRWTLTAQTTGNVVVTATGFDYNLTVFPLPGSYTNNKTYATIMRDGSATMGTGTCNPGNAVSHTRNSMTGFSQFEIAQGEVPMPVDGIFLSGTRNANDVWLDWLVIAPRQVTGYQVERKIEATQTEFIPVAFVSANEPLTFKDLNVPGGKLSYRIAAIDYDGTRSLSNVVEISESNIPSIKLYPNPVAAGEPIFIKGVSQLINEVEFIDVTGKILKTPVTQLSGGTLIIPTAGKPAGVYLIKTGNETILKLIIQ